MQFGKTDSQLPPGIQVNEQGFDHGQLATEQNTCVQKSLVLHIQSTEFSGQVLYQALNRRLLSLNTHMVDILNYQSTDKNLKQYTAQISQIRALLHHIDTKKSYSGIHIQYCSAYSESLIFLSPNKALYVFNDKLTERYGLFGKK